MANKPLPGVQIFALADNAYQDATTRKWVLAGVFNRWHAAALPLLTPPFSIYIRLTDVATMLPWKLRLVWLKDSSTLLELQGESSPGNDRLLPTDIHIRMPVLPIEAFGAYAFQFFAFDEEQYLKEMRVFVVKQEVPDGNG